MKYFILYLFLFFVIVTKSQNLVPNPSFETFTLCPTSVGQIESALPWNAATAISSTDYFNSCATNANVNVPYNTAGGFQYARTGNSYAGFGFSYVSGQREYLQVQLASPLVSNKIYYIEFFVNLHNNYTWCYPCNNIAANLSLPKPYSSNTYDLQSLTPHIILPGNPIISDTLNWIQISGCYTAQGGEEYLTIGNFFDNTNTLTSGTTTASYASYYLVDDVRVEEIPGVCVVGLNELNSNYQIQVYPNPTAGNLNITLNGLNKTENLTVKITDVLGREVLKETYKEELDISGLEKGIYFISMMHGNKTLDTKKVIKE